MKLGVLVSGRGSNMAAILDAVERGHLQSRVVIVLSDVADAPALERARKAGITAEYLETESTKPKLSRTDAGRYVARLREAEVDLIVLAGFMRILGKTFFEAFGGRILNIHPSLLPAFKGLEPQKRAIEAGASESGCTVHFVTPRIDDGPIVAQARVPILKGDTVAALSDRILAEEHRVYVEALRRIEIGEVSLPEGGGGAVPTHRGGTE